MQPLSFGNYTDATTNGSQLGTTGVAANNLQMGTLASAPTGSNGLPSATVASPTTPGATSGAGTFWKNGDGSLNTNNIGLVLGGVQMLGNLWNSYQAHKLAKEQMAFAREQWDTNLANQTQTYNTALEDRIRGRYAVGERTDAQVQEEVSRHAL
ncbi:structural protein [Ruegeria phage vB_RpoP-V13]|uniref:Structural protein n=1 Tax=Ruegeria phage vB_RpoP-V13 TaxID=2218612 RepID=A0A2Z4QHI1_9CAUD|nr:structural protein [Ruegeria phage vB_RpoP-V13]AWY09413.1 structural protein [Ruegeria phage vB_RpoP-V13]